MSTNLQFRLTSAGQQAAWNANNTGISLDLTHVQFGSGNRAPTGTETALVTPKAYVAIAAGSRVAPDQIRLSALLTGAASFNIGEIGIWKGVPGQAGSVLFAYWSQAAGYLGSKAPGVDFIFTHDMVLSDAVAAGSVNIVADTSQSAMLAMMADHEAKADPHPQYLLPSEADSAYVKKTGDTMTGPLLLKQGLPGIGGLSFPEISYDTGLFSTGDGILKLMANGYAAVDIDPSADLVFRIAASEVFRAKVRNNPVINDYLLLPNGRIIQWLLVTPTTYDTANALQTTAFNWPIAFPNDVFVAASTIEYGVPTSYAAHSIESKTKNGANLVFVSGSANFTPRINVIAMGW